MSLRLGFLASHGGTSMRAIVAAIDDATLAAMPALVIGNNRDAPALDFARARGLPWRHVSATSAGSAAAADRAMTDALAAAEVNLVVLSGYLRKLGPLTLARFAGRILNVHPALLPKFGGQGMYGNRVHAAVLAAGEPVSGATIHLVDEHYDQGPVLAQAEVPVLPGDDVDALAARVAQAETRLFVATLRRIADGSLRLPDGP